MAVVGGHLVLALYPNNKNNSVSKRYNPNCSCRQVFLAYSFKSACRVIFYRFSTSTGLFMQLLVIGSDISDLFSVMQIRNELKFIVN